MATPSDCGMPFALTCVMTTATPLLEPVRTPAQPARAAAPSQKKRADDIEERDAEEFGQVMNQMMVHHPREEQKSATEDGAQKGDPAAKVQLAQTIDVAVSGNADQPDFVAEVPAPEEGQFALPQTQEIASDVKGAAIQDKSLPGVAAASDTSANLVEPAADTSAKPQKPNIATSGAAAALLAGKAAINEAEGKMFGDASREKAGGSGRAGAEPNATVAGKAEFNSLLRTDTTIVQHHAAQAAAPALTEETRLTSPVSRPQAADPAEAIDNTVAIMKGSNRLAVTLEPDGLGKLNINLSLDKGIINAHFNVADDSARNLISNNMQQIMHSLAKDGLSVGGFSVSLREGGNGGGGYSEPGAFAAKAEAEGNGSAQIAGTAERSVAGIVNIFV